MNRVTVPSMCKSCQSNKSDTSRMPTNKPSKPVITSSHKAPALKESKPIMNGKRVIMSRIPPARH